MLSGTKFTVKLFTSNYIYRTLIIVFCVGVNCGSQPYNITRTQHIGSLRESNINN